MNNEKPYENIRKNGYNPPPKETYRPEPPPPSPPSPSKKEK